MTSAAYLRDVAIPGAYALLPAAMRSTTATALLLAIALQESRCESRRQVPKGPARGFWQFEAGGGVKGVIWHQATRVHASRALNALSYAPFTVADVHEAITHNDVLAAVFARLLLWSDPAPLPEPADVTGAWRYYERTWRPGKPRPIDWPEHYAKAYEFIEGS